MHGKAVITSETHKLTFRRLLTCATCGRSLIGERQKGHTYYRCHSKECRPLCLREEAVDTSVRQKLRLLIFSKDEEEVLDAAAKAVRNSWFINQKAAQDGIRSALGGVTSRLTRLTYAFLDGSIEKATFDERKSALLNERRGLEERLAILDSGSRSGNVELSVRLIRFAKQAYFVYDLADPGDKRNMVNTSPRTGRFRGITLQFLWILRFRLSLSGILSL